MLTLKDNFLGYIDWFNHQCFSPISSPAIYWTPIHIHSIYPKYLRDEWSRYLLMRGQLENCVARGHILGLWQRWASKPSVSNFKLLVAKYEAALATSLFVPKSTEYSGFWCHKLKITEKVQELNTRLILQKYSKWSLEKRFGVIFHKVLFLKYKCMCASLHRCPMYHL